MWKTVSGEENSKQNCIKKCEQKMQKKSLKNKCDQKLLEKNVKKNWNNFVNKNVLVKFSIAVVYGKQLLSADECNAVWPNF